MNKLPREGRLAPPYEPPSVVDYGTLQEVTAGNATGVHLDRAFPAGTPKDDLTFSH
jgi:hypothetical protein